MSSILYLAPEPDADFETANQLSINRCLISKDTLTIGGLLTDNLVEGFYCIKLDLTRTCLKDLKGFIVSSFGWIESNSEKVWGVANKGLVDEDYPKTEVCFGVYFPFNKTVVVNIETTFEMFFKIGDFLRSAEFSGDLMASNYWPPTEHHIFRSALYSSTAIERKVQLVGLHHSSERANGLDLVFDGLEDVQIQPMGNLIIHWYENLPPSFDLLPGYFILRSRFMRRGLVVVVCPLYRCFWLMNSSPKYPITLKKRTIQYIPLGTTDLLSNFERLEVEPQTNKREDKAKHYLYTRWSTPDKFTITCCRKERKSKFSP